MKKAVLSFFLVGILGITLNYSIIFADNQATLIKLDGKLFNTPKGELQSYISKEGRIMLPIRFLAIALEIPDDTQHIRWDRENNMVNLTHNQISIDIQVGNKTIFANKKAIHMDTAPINKNERVFLPLRYMAEAFGFKIAWEEESHIVHILTEESNNLAQFNLVNTFGDFPIKVQGDGYDLTLNDVHIYPYESQDTKALIDKYELKAITNGTPYYLVWMNIGITNTDGKAIGSDLQTNQSPFSFGFNPADEDRVQPIQTNKNKDIMYNGDIIYKWRLASNQSLQGHIALILIHKEIERFFVKTDKAQITVAIRQS